MKKVNNKIIYEYPDLTILCRYLKEHPAFDPDYVKIWSPYRSGPNGSYQDACEYLAKKLLEERPLLYSICLGLID